ASRRCTRSNAKRCGSRSRPRRVIAPKRRDCSASHARPSTRAFAISVFDHAPPSHATPHIDMKILRPTLQFSSLTVVLLFANSRADAAQLFSQSRSYHTGDVAAGSAYRPEVHTMVDLDNDNLPDIVCADVGDFSPSARFSV